MNVNLEVSIVIPVYNAAKFLNACVESIVNQKTKWSYEAIFINDGSTDNSLEILEQWANTHDNLVIIDQENEGVSSARNAGIDAAHGKYIVFVDSDDWIDESYIEDLRNSIHDDRCGIVIQGMLKELPNRTETRRFESALFELQNFAEFITKEQIYHNGFPFSKIFKLDVIKKMGLRFCEKVKYSEDLMFLLRYLVFCDWFVYDFHVNYHYRNTEQGTLVRSYADFQSELAGYREFKDALNLLQSRFCIGQDCLVGIHRWLHYFAMRSIKTIYRRGKNYLPRKERCRLLRESFSDDDFLFFASMKKDISGLDKIICSLICLRKIVLLDLILNVFFVLRSCFFINWIVRMRYGEK